jgi:hypothetical protein
MKNYYGTRLPEVLMYFATTKGCHMLCSDPLGNVLAYTTTLENPYKVDPNGNALFVQWLDSTDLKALMSLFDLNVDYIIYERHSKLHILKSKYLHR